MKAFGKRDIKKNTKKGYTMIFSKIGKIYSVQL